MHCDMTWFVTSKVVSMSLTKTLADNVLALFIPPSILASFAPSHLLHLSLTPCWSIYQEAIILKHHYKWNQCSGKPINLYILPLPQAQDLNVIEEVIRMMLEIINSCLCNSLHHNPNLVYALLYKRELFEQFRTHPSFQDIMQNLDMVGVDGVCWSLVISP